MPTQTWEQHEQEQERKREIPRARLGRRPPPAMEPGEAEERMTLAEVKERRWREGTARRGSTRAKRAAERQSFPRLHTSRGWRPGQRRRRLARRSGRRAPSG